MDLMMQGVPVGPLFAALNLVGHFSRKDNFFEAWRACDPTHRKMRDGWGTRMFVLDQQY